MKIESADTSGEHDPTAHLAESAEIDTDPDGAGAISRERVFETVRERDVDLLILEEFSSSPSFLTWWLTEMGSKYPSTPSSYHFSDAHHSLSLPGYGESDLVLRVTDSSSRVLGVLVEVKIDAPPQKDQAVRYQERGIDGKKCGLWNDFVTCIAARKSYLSAHGEEANLYNSQISLEDLKDWFDESRELSPERALYKQELLKEAIKKSHHGKASVIAIPEITTFWAGYRKLANDEFPELQLANDGKKGHRFVRVPFVRQIPGPRVIHQLKHGNFSYGYVDLQFRGQAGRLDALRKINAALLDSEIKVEKAGGSAAFRIRVPAIDIKLDLALQEDQIRQGLRAALRLQMLAPSIRIEDPTSL